MAFPDCPAPLAAAISARGYAEPTDVQAAVLSSEAHARDLIVSAQTGSGKTVAFGLAMATDLLGADNRPHEAHAPLALVVAPTRELALQVSRELAWLYAHAGARLATCVGGMDASRERRMLAARPQIVVGTPGRLRDHLERGALDLSALKVAVLDEADEMLDMGFREDLEELLDATPEGRRTLLFSATMPRPIVALAKRYQRDALRLETRGADRGHGDIAYQAILVAPADIENAAVNLLRLHEADTAILFCATRDNVRHLHASLVERGFAAVALSGEHSQSERNHALQALRDRRARVCVATDVAARGIDLPTLTLVIHVELPRDAETLQHRSGRTGRAGKKGVAALIVPYPRRRRVELLLRDAGVQAEWRQPPTAEEVVVADRARLIERLLAPIETDSEDAAIAAQLLEQRSPEEIAALLVHAHRAALPRPEELIPDTGPPQRERGARPERAERAPREGFEDSVWFRIDAGRRHNADPRWLLPLLCRRAHVTRGDIGAIRIGMHESFVEIPRGIADRVADTLRRTLKPGAEDESGLAITPAPGGPTIGRGPPSGGGGKPRGPHGGPRPQGASRPQGGPRAPGAPRSPGAPRPQGASRGPGRPAGARPPRGPKR